MTTIECCGDWRWDFLLTFCRLPVLEHCHVNASWLQRLHIGGCLNSWTQSRKTDSEASKEVWLPVCSNGRRVGWVCLLNLGATEQTAPISEVRKSTVYTPLPQSWILWFLNLFLIVPTQDFPQWLFSPVTLHPSSALFPVTHLTPPKAFVSPPSGEECCPLGRCGWKEGEETNRTCCFGDLPASFELPRTPLDFQGPAALRAPVTDLWGCVQLPKPTEM